MEERSNICVTLIDDTKHSNDITSLNRKLSKKSKSKKRKADKKERRKHKKKSKHVISSSSSRSDDSSEFDWVEKKVEDQTTLHTDENLVNSKAQTNQLERDEWMNFESFLPCTSKSDMRKQKSDNKKEERTNIFLSKPGQSNRELNPYWKDGGDGLPQNRSKIIDNPQIMDANWLKRSLQRAEEQALRDGKSLEEVAVERWGSLEIIQSMIIKAEKMSNTEQNTSYHKKYYDRNNKDSHRSSRRKNRSRSRSRSKERAEKHSTSDYLFQHHTSQQKQTYQRSKVKDNYYQEIAHGSTSNRTKNWKKTKDDGKKPESSKLKETNVENVDVNVTDKKKDIGLLTEAEMNKLGARIIKAELMGDDELAVQLKVQLEQARKLAATNNSNAQEETVILTITDAKGIARPIQPRNQFEQSIEGHRKKKTHVSSQKKCDFLNNDKYSLQKIFQQEKGRSTNEDEAMFVKFASKSAGDMDDEFEQQIAQKDLEAKQDKRDRARAIKEHKDLSKFIDNCWWCLDSKNMLKHMIITMDSEICLSLPACTSLINGHCILTPIQHVACQLHLDEDVWNRLKELKRKLIDMFSNEDLYPIFFEIYKKHRRFSHMQLECIPLPKEIGELAPMYFKKALLECETEWSVNKKIVDLKHKDIRHAVPNSLSYFMVEFASHSGYAHVIEDEELFPKNFAEEIIGGMLDLDCQLWRKPKRLSFDEQRVKVLQFTEMWKKYNSS
ncbi:CWF19-like protein 2 [Linepithema humile]|uniref:CWF19-like protein 2 n=1 Tax=Linepithema humile TaxID=83485 RepID=UPI00351F39DA